MVDRISDGYQMAKDGLPCPSDDCPSRVEGWKTFHDQIWWEKLADALGYNLTGFTYRSSATMVSDKGEVMNLSGPLVQRLEELLLPKVTP